MKIVVPDRGSIDINYAVFDFNGTLALDGILSSKTREQLVELAKLMPIYVLTADTNGTAARECQDIPLILKCYSSNSSNEKAKIVTELGANNCVCYGNGFNDIEMFKLTGLSVAILGHEGVSGKLLLHSDLVMKDIDDGISLLTNTTRIISGLRD